ncbi:MULTISPECIES: EAL domain-containing protein [unclassified Herbaspirillum]|uniref:EAL domain-containing protein n=1 Tax=unclassified Herbaspirillum TaxID=2624150 RepID=UPI00383B1EE1
MPNTTNNGSAASYLPALESAVLNTWTAALMVVDATVENAPIVFVNLAFSELTGYQLHEIMGRDCRFLQGRERPERAEDALKQMQRQGHTRLVARNYRRDGTPFWNEVTLSLMTDATGRITHFIAVLIDVSDRFTGLSQSGYSWQPDIYPTPIVVDEQSLIEKERLFFESSLRQAVLAKDFHLQYQPVISMRTGDIIGLEALVRWTHSSLGAVSPSHFISVAEELGLIEDIGDWVLQTACLDMRRREAAGLAPLRVAVNVSPYQFSSPRLTDLIQDAIERNDLDTSMLCLEITEGAVMLDTENTRTTLRRLKAMGIDLLLDDFGTGFSSLSYLKRFPFDRVKIDRSFVTNLTEDSDDAAITKAIISMAHSLGIKVIAEGIETEAQFAILRDQQCDEMQGYLFSRGISSEELDVLLREGKRLPSHLFGAGNATRTILLVDDEAEMLSQLQEPLRRDNYEILMANNGEEALAILETHEVDVILSDQSMAGMTGVELLRSVQVLYPETIRIILSGFSELQSVTDAINDGAVYKFLTKPWDETKLRAHIHEAFMRKELSNENRFLGDQIKIKNLELDVLTRKLHELSAQKKATSSSKIETRLT